jgi:hypothetical protein
MMRIERQQALTQLLRFGRVAGGHGRVGSQHQETIARLRLAALIVVVRQLQV